MDAEAGPGPSSAREELLGFVGHATKSSESSADVVADVEVPDDDNDDKFSWRQLWAFMGPGFLMSIAYVDPGNLESDLQAGAKYGNTLLWILLWATVCGLAIQMLTVRLALATGMHLSQLCRSEYPKRVRIPLWLVAEMTIVASDVPEVIGTAFALKLLFGIPTFYGVLITGLDTMLFLAVQAFGVRKLEALISALVGAMALCFLVEGVMAWDDPAGIAEGLLVPTVRDSGALFIAISLLGAIIMPHNLYLHSALVLTRAVRPGAPAARRALQYNAVESAIALAVTLFVNIAVVTIAAATIDDPSVSPELRKDLIDAPLQNASHLLRNVLGPSAAVLFGIALLASGQSSTMTGTYAGQFVMEGFLRMKLAPWLRSLITRSVAILPSLAVTWVMGDQGSEQLIVISSVVLAIQLPYGLIPLVKFVSAAGVMGPMALSSRERVGSWVLSAVIVGANMVLIVQTLFESGILAPTAAGVLLGILCAAATLAYLGTLFYLALRPVTTRLVEDAGTLPRDLMQHAAVLLKPSPTSSVEGDVPGEGKFSPVMEPEEPASAGQREQASLLPASRV